nr:ribonuclease H-like domain-containing protein [Tanacetum cinerariifolium]
MGLLTDECADFERYDIGLTTFTADIGTWGNLQMNLQDKGVVASGCSRHVIGNMSYLTDYEEIEGGYVAFGGKFNGKADEGFFVGYSLNGKEFRVFNSRTRIVEENLHIRFNENTPNVVCSGLDWLFDIDALTRTMNYKPIVAGTQSNNFAGSKANDNTDDGFQTSSDHGKKVDEDLRQKDKYKDQEKEDNVKSTNNVNAAGANRVNIVGANTNKELPFDPEMPSLEDISTFNFSSDREDDDEMADMNNLDTTI